MNAYITCNKRRLFWPRVYFKLRGSDVEIGIQIRSVEDSVKMIVDRKTVIKHLFEEQVDGKNSCSDNMHAPLTIIKSCNLE